MELFEKKSEVRKYLQKIRPESIRTGLVPTMGALHEGHLSLIRASKSKDDLTIASIFVNPAQFNNPEDLEKYPRNPEKDLALLQKAGCGAVFMPSVREIYPEPPDLEIRFGSIENVLEGRFRPGHFKGVGLIVAKLFNMIRPDHAYFGQKDLQQFHVIEKLVRQLSFPVTLEMVPTVREASGLALSSRNERLSPEDREAATLLYKSLQAAQNRIASGGSVREAKTMVDELFRKAPRLRLEYFEVVDTPDFKPLETIENAGSAALCIAAHIGNVRLIDNLRLIS